MGLGLTGRMFALEHWRLEPDVLLLAKSLSGGYVPVGACLLGAEPFNSVFDSKRNALAHISTFAGSDLAMGAGLATLRELGELLLERHEVVREVRGPGLAWAIEFAEPRSRGHSRRLLERLEPGVFAQLVVGPLFAEHRILTQVAAHGISVITVLPPLTLSEVDIEQVRVRARQGPQRRPAVPEGGGRFRAAGDARVARASEMAGEPAPGRASFGVGRPREMHAFPDGGAR